MILLTGATGFVGSAILKVLQKSDYNVVAAVRSVKTDSPSNFAQVGEINGQTDFSAALAGVDVVIHVAARAHVMKDDAADSLAEFRKVNVEGTVALAKQAVKAGVKRFVFISSIGVNGLNSNVPFTENNQASPHDPYSQSKCEAEIQLEQIAAESGLGVVIIRPPLVYGAAAPGNFQKILQLSLKSIPLPFGSVHNKRSMVYVENLVDFIFRCVEHPAAANQTFLISDNDDTSLARLITTIRQSAGMPKRLLPVPIFLFKLAGKLTGKQAVVDRLVGDLQVDSSKARILLNWQPPFTFEEGIAATVKHFQLQEK